MLNFNRIINTLLFSIIMVLVSCVQVKFSDDVQEEIQQLFFDDGASLESVTMQAESALSDLSIKLPDFFDENVKRANDVCSPDGSLNLDVISSDPAVQNKYRPFFEFYCQTKSKDKNGILQNTDIVQSLACVSALTSLMNYEMGTEVKTSKISFSKIKKCFETDFSKTWFETHIEPGETKNLTLKLTKLNNTKSTEFNYELFLTANNFSGKLKFNIGNHLSGLLLEYRGQGVKTVFGISTEFYQSDLIVRYDLMSEVTDFNNDFRPLVFRSRMYGHLNKDKNGVRINDLDFWALSSDSTKFILDQVSGGENFGLSGARHILQINGNGQEVMSSDWSSCMNQAVCLERDIKVPQEKNLYELGKVDLLGKSMNEVVNDNLIYVHNNAHFRLVPNISTAGWLEIDNELSYFKGSFMNSRVEDNFLYLTGGEIIDDQEVIKNNKVFKINLESLVVEKVSIDTSMGPSNLKFGEGIFENDEIKVKFGGYDPNTSKFLNSGTITLKKSTGDEVHVIRPYSEGGPELPKIDWDIFHRINPTITYTGRHVIIYGGLHYDNKFRLSDVNDGFVIDLSSMNAWKMNTENAPRWITQAVWTGEHLIAYGGYDVDYSEVYPQKIAHGNGGIYHLGTNSWSELPSAPIAPRVGHQLIWYNDRLLVFGGQSSIINLEGLNSTHTLGAALFVPGIIEKIYFTEKSVKSMFEDSITTQENIGEFYLEGEIHSDSKIRVFSGSRCEKSRLGELPQDVRIEYLSIGKAKITFKLEKGPNLISVQVNNDEKKSCTNALNFVRR